MSFKWLWLVGLSLLLMGDGATSELGKLVGRYPREVKLWESEPLKSRLQTLLGQRAELLRRNMEVEGPIQHEGPLYFVMGNRPHYGGEEAAIIAIDERADVIHVWLLSGGRLDYYADGRSDLPMPTDIEMMLSDWEQ